jgi:pimeloyl-ACP methyl ester carboxylesterase
LPEWWFDIKGSYRGLIFLNNFWGKKAYNHQIIANQQYFLKMDGVLSGALGWYRSSIRNSYLAPFSSQDHQQSLTLMADQFTQIPTLFITGALSQEAKGIEENAAVKKKMVVVENAGHFIHHEQPE